MTCVLTSTPPPWQHFDSVYGWSPMNPADPSTSAYGDRTSQYGYASSDTDSRKASGSSGSKKRASRAGTRSVSTLSAAQLERKRANDREAQRAIRQRTKDHIDNLERTVADLTNEKQARERMYEDIQNRNRQLEEEVGYLRNKLGEPAPSGYQLSIHPPEHSRASEQQAMSAHTASPVPQAAPVGIPLADSDPSSRSLSLATSHSSASRAGSWQQGASGYPGPTSNPPAGISIPGAVPVGQSLTTWRSHENAPSAHSTPTSAHPAHGLPYTPYASSNPGERPQWAAPVSTYNYTDAKASPHQAPQYAPPPVQAYSTSPAQAQQQAYSQGPPPPQAEFQGMQVSSPAAYQVPAQAGFSQTGQFPMAQMQHPSGAAEYAGQQGHMPSAAVPQAGYQGAPEGQQYSAQQQAQQPMQFRDESGARSYSLNHYPSG